MSNFKKNEFVKWTATDEEGQFSHKGKVTRLTKTEVDITTQNDGVITVGLTDGSFTKIKKIKNFSAPSKNIGRTAMQNAVVKAKRKTGGPSKKDRAIELYRNMTSALGVTPARQYAIGRFVDELGMTVAGASTYVAMAKKAQ